MKFRPILKERIWGGRRLETLFGRPLPSGLRIGESWELADLPADKSVVVNGPLSGLDLCRVLEDYPEALTGSRKPPARFPLLVKLLDCEDVLSVQVHPDREACRRLGRGDLKTECWYIMDASEGAVIYKGLKPGVTRRAFEEAIQSGAVADLLCKVTVRPGECHFLPAGTPHAIGAGLLIAEIQTPSDTTFRVFDWNRLDAAGQPRPLHVTEALESIHFDASRDDLSVRSAGRLVDCDFFKIDKVMPEPDVRVPLNEGVMQALVFIRGSGQVTGDAGDLKFRAGDTLLVPAAVRGDIRFDPSTGDPEYLTVTLE